MSRTRGRDRNKLTPAGVVLLGLFAAHFAMIVAVNSGVELTSGEQDAWMAGVMVPMFVAWLTVMIEELIWHW
jgi:hypothetical protein